MANPFVNDNTIVIRPPIDRALEGEINSTIELQNKRDSIRKKVNNPNLTNEQVDLIIYNVEHPIQLSFLSKTEVKRDRNGKPMSKALLAKRTILHENAMKQVVDINDGLRLFGYSNLSDKAAELNPELVAKVAKDAALDASIKGASIAAFIPGMLWLRGFSAPAYYGLNTALTAGSAADWYKNGANFWNVTGTIGGAFDLGLPAVLKIKNNLFIPKEGTYTRGIGRGTEGLEDLINTGIVRGNPRGTEVTASSFAKLFRKNRDHFRDIMKSTNIKGIENKFFSRTLTKEEFDAIKKASRLYTTKKMVNNNGSFDFRDVPADPLERYGTYDDYIRIINDDVANVERMPSRIASGEIKVSKGSNRPIEERFGTNSDYIEDGTPLSYWYSDGRNPFSRGHDYAGSNYAVRVNNPEVYLPFMHEFHLHPSFRYAPKFNDSNIEVFRRLPFGIGWRMSKKQLLSPNSSTNISYSISDLSNPARSYYYWNGTPRTDWSNFDTELFKLDALNGKQDFIDWMTSPAYRLAALNNRAEAEAMGLSYTPIWEKPSFKKTVDNFKPVISLTSDGALGWVTSSDPAGVIHLNALNRLSLRPVVRHEMAHSSRLAWADPELVGTKKYNPRKENEYLRFKNSEVFDDGADFTNRSLFYDFTKEGFPHEAVTNTRDLGERLGIKVGESYPGDTKVLEIINEVQNKYPNSFYGEMVKHFRRDNLQAVWKALNGTQWLLIPGLAYTSTKQ